MQGFLKSLAPLSNVIFLATFSYLIFAIMAIQLWGFSGSMHGRCRGTPLPVRFNAGTVFYANTTLADMTAAANYSDPCLSDVPAYAPAGAPLDDPAWGKDESPWSTPQRCIWPIYYGPESRYRLCALPGNAGQGTCKVGDVCGSNFDRWGNARFTERTVMMSENNVPELMFEDHVRVLARSP